MSAFIAVAFLRSKIAAIAASCYLLAFVCASLYPLFDHRTFSGLAAVMLALPWIDHLPKGAPIILLVGCAMLNAIIIYVVVAAITLVPSIIRQARL